jgi:SAM-dependent methyltransferase
MNQNLKIWSQSNAFRKELLTNHPPSYPNEMLVKICSSKYYSNLNKLFLEKNRKIDVCEIGCFSGNNLRLFFEKKYNVYGVDVNNEIIEMCKKNLKRLNYNIRNFNLGIGNNLKIPFNKKFDAIVSINTIHYNYGNDIFESINYLKSKIKKNGLLIIETPAPDHEVFKKSKKISKLIYKFMDKNDFRYKQNLGLFENKKHFYSTLKKYFKKVEICIRTEKFGNSQSFQFYQAICLN